MAKPASSSDNPNAPRQQQRPAGAQGESPTANQQISIDQRAQDRMRKLFELIRARRPEIEAVLPSDVPYMKFEAVVNMAIRREPRLLDTYGPSFIKACIQGAYDGLLPDGNQAVILYSNNKVPGTGRDGRKALYRLEARYQSMVYGLRLKIVQSGAATFVDAKVVFSKEHFVHQEGLDPILEHTPILEPEARGDPIAAYAIARLPGGDKVFDVLSKADVLAAREVAKTKDVWDGAFKFEMWKKTAIRRLSKAIPTVTPIRDAEAIELFPQFGGQQPAALPAPPRPDRRDYARIEERVEVPLDLGAFEGGYETEESIAVTREQDDKPERRKRQPKAVKPEAEREEDREQDEGLLGRDDEGRTSNQEGEEEEERQNEPGTYQPKIMVPTSPPRDEAGWRYYADQVKAALPELRDADEINAERRAHQDMIDQAPGAIGDELADAFADALTDLV